MIDGGKKKGSKEPDVTIALFKGLREITVYESNMYRLDMEDPKGLEVVLLLGAAAIRDIYFATSLWDAFNVPDISKRKSSSPTAGSGAVPSQLQQRPTVSLSQQPTPSRSSSDPYRRHQNPPAPSQQPPTADPLTQWQINAETARLKKQHEAEQRERERADQAEIKQIGRAHV